MTRPYRVVIADDEKPVAVGLQNQLESLGYDVVAVVNDGQRAIEMCRRTLPDAVFLDIEMPGLDGLSAARQIAVDPGTPVIILTAHGHPNLIDQAVEDGVISYLLKPATNPSLHAAVQVAVARARELKALQDDVDELKSTLAGAEADRAGQGDPDVAPAPQRERSVPAACSGRARIVASRWPSWPNRSSRPTNCSRPPTRRACPGCGRSVGIPTCLTANNV